MHWAKVLVAGDQAVGHTSLPQLCFQALTSNGKPSGIPIWHRAKFQARCQASTHQEIHHVAYGFVVKLLFNFKNIDVHFVLVFFYFF